MSSLYEVQCVLSCVLSPSIHQPLKATPIPSLNQATRPLGEAEPLLRGVVPVPEPQLSHPHVWATSWTVGGATVLFQNLYVIIIELALS